MCAGRPFGVWTRAMPDQTPDADVQQLRLRVQLAEEVIRAVEDDALPPAALPAWERYRAQFPRDIP
jgi:hypothetical protein